MDKKRLMRSILAIITMLCLLLPGIAAAEDVFGIPRMDEMEERLPIRYARFRAVGDLMVHEKQLEIAQQPDGSYDFYPQYALIADSLADADYTIANLETTIGMYKGQPYSGFPMFNTPESLLDTIRDAGIDFLTLANNHMLDRYFDGMVNTVNCVERWGFDHGGANRSPQEKEAPVVVEVNGIRIGMLCYTEMTNGVEELCSEDAVLYGVNYLGKADFSQDVQRLKEAGAEVIFAMPHWGEEYHRQPEELTVYNAKRLIAAGVDVVLGSHPHMVQPVRYLTVDTADGGRRTGLVAYCMGNFISNMTVQYTDSGIILEFSLVERPDGGFDVVDVGYVPIYCWKTDTSIQAISSYKYYDQPPEGMDEQTYNRMKASFWELRDLLGEDMLLLKE